MLAHYGPAGEWNPGWDEGPNTQVEEDVAVVDGIVHSCLWVVDWEERVEYFAPEVCKPGEAAPYRQGEYDGQDYKKVVYPFCEPE